MLFKQVRYGSDGKASGFSEYEGRRIHVNQTQEPRGVTVSIEGEDSVSLGFVADGPDANSTFFQLDGAGNTIDSWSPASFMPKPDAAGA